ncbi:glycosyltransferase family 4 protein [Marinobacter sp.]|uniref:glycosyltransferase family 4 protein n=1 Tax=Marinobacter sp. TaxID=50741 RepID=UPI0035C76B4C|nr:glycosyltransferase family 4 protein [Pseudomonadales bacterium]
MDRTLWYISKYFAPKTSTSPGGRGWFLMERLAGRGIKPVVITSDSNELIDKPDLRSPVTIEETEGISVVWLRTMKYQVAKSTRRILSWFHFEFKVLSLNKALLPKPDVIVVSSLSLLTVLSGLWLKRKYGCRLVFEVRDIWPLTIVEEGGFKASNPLIKVLSFVERLGYEKSDAIIGTMPNLAEHVRRVSNSDAPVSCVPMGVSNDHLQDQRELSPGYVERYLSSERLKVVHAGTVGITNALDVFFEAASRLESDGSFEFVIVGDGPLKEQYEKDYSHLSNLVFAPKVDRHEVQSVLAQCDIVYFSVFPSRVWDYGQSLNKVVDYMLSAKPVIASYSGFPSMINEAGCGSFVPAGDVDALVEELRRFAQMNTSDRDAIGTHGRTWLLENRTYDKLADEFESAAFGKTYNV